MGNFCAVGIIKVLGSILGCEELKEELRCLNHHFLPFYCLLKRKHDIEYGLCANGLEQAI